MKKILLIIAGIITVLVIVAGAAAFITNPGEKEMKDEYKKVLLDKYHEDLGKRLEGNPYKDLGMNLGKEYITNLVKNRTERLNYYLFSELELSFKGKKKIVGLGVFGIVHIYEFGDYMEE